LHSDRYIFALQQKGEGSMQIRILHCSPLFLLFLVSPTFSQNKIPVSDPQAVALATKTMAALTNGLAVTDVTLSANVTWIAGSDNETGTATLQAKGTAESRVDLALSAGNKSEVRNASAAPLPAGGWTGTDGASHTAAMHNCWTDASWFFPALSSLSVSDPSVVLTYLGAETRAGISVQQLQSYRYLTNVDTATAARFQTLSTMDFYLDANSLLPLSTTFNAHPDADAGANILIEIDFSNYQAINGVQIPLHVQKYLQGGRSMKVSLGLTLGWAEICGWIPRTPCLRLKLPRGAGGRRVVRTVFTPTQTIGIVARLKEPYATLALLVGGDGPAHR
jgi:hypothetical protein